MKQSGARNVQKVTIESQGYCRVVNGTVATRQEKSEYILFDPWDVCCISENLCQGQRYSVECLSLSWAVTSS